MLSPEYTSYEYIDEGLYVPEEGCDYAEVEAATKKEAKVLGVREFRSIANGRPWGKGCTGYSASDENPFTGVKVQLMTECTCATLSDIDIGCPWHGPPDTEADDG